MGSDDPGNDRLSERERVLVYAPIGRDAPVLSHALAQAGIETISVPDADALSAAMEERVDVLLLSQEALTPSTLQVLSAFLGAQPQWSELPLIVLLDDNFQTERKIAALRGHIVNAGLTVLQRPVRATELVTAVQVAMRARSRQYELGEHLANQQLLIREVNHRVKNALSSVVAIYEHTLRRSDSLEGFAEIFQGRLHALSQIHSLLASREWGHIDLCEIAELTIAPYRQGSADQVTIRGKSIPLRPKAALTLAMCFHELATNGAKYGVFSHDSGRLQLSWKTAPRDGHKLLIIRWVERGGPKMKPPSNRGFGTRFIEASIAHETGGTAMIDFAEAGLECEMSIPLDAVRAAIDA